MEHVDKSAKIHVDNWRGYGGVKKIYKHSVVNHGKRIYKSEDGGCTNNIEGFWGTFFKRAMSGTYSMASGQHLQRYCDEFAFRFNNRNVSEKERFEIVMKEIEHRYNL